MTWTPMTGTLMTVIVARIAQVDESQSEGEPTGFLTGRCDGRQDLYYMCHTALDLKLLATARAFCYFAVNSVDMFMGPEALPKYKCTMDVTLR